MILTKTIFISRELSEDSPIQALSAEGFTVIGKSLLSFSAIDFAPPAAADYIFFYSRNAVDYFLKHPKANALLKQANIATIGSKTALLLEEQYDCQADFIGSGLPHKIAEEFKKVLGNKTCLFPRAMNSRKSIQKVLLPAQVLDLVCYDNTIHPSVIIPSTDIVILTSPMNAAAYLMQHSLADKTLITIGETTRSYLRDQGIKNILSAKEPSEESIRELVMGM